MKNWFLDKRLYAPSYPEEGQPLLDMLKLPSQNHAPSSNEFLTAPLCERFLIDVQDLEDLQKIENTRLIAQPPENPIAIIICNPDLLNQPMLIIYNRNDFFVFQLANYIWVYICSVHSAFSHEGYYQEWAPGIVKDASEEEAVMSIAYAALGAIQMHRVVSTKQIVKKDHPTMRLAARRAAQRGVPWFSHNIVKLRRPETSDFRGEIIQGRACGGAKRAHITRGHWRLISLHKNEEGEMVPYWTWVTDHKRGDETKGRIVKTSIVEFSEPSELARHGYLVPSGPGAAGQRIKARRVGA